VDETNLTAAAGIMWKNAPPSSAPTANATSGVSTRCSAVSLSSSVMLPDSAIVLISNPLPTIQQRVSISRLVQ